MNKYFDLFGHFLKLGATGFGGPLALLAQMNRDFVENRKWIDPEEFQKALAIIKSMPGPVAFSMAVYLGKRRAGFLGACLAALGFLLPSFFLVILFAANYAYFSALPKMSGIFLGMQAAAMALILASVKPLAGTNIKKVGFWLTAIVGGLLFHFDWLPEPVLILLGGGFWILWKKKSTFFVSVIVVEPAMLKELFWVCFQAGAFVFGSGVAITPMLEEDFVERLNWISRQEFMDALAVGQVTPGPVLIATTFIGYRLANIVGAVVATTGVFLASFIHMSTWFPRALDRLSRLTWIGDFIFGALSVVIGTILVTTLKLSLSWGTYPAPYILMAVVLLASLKTKIPSWVTILFGASVGYFI